MGETLVFCITWLLKDKACSFCRHRFKRSGLEWALLGKRMWGHSQCLTCDSSNSWHISNTGRCSDSIHLETVPMLSPWEDIKFYIGFHFFSQAKFSLNDQNPSVQLMHFQLTFHFNICKFKKWVKDCSM